MTAQGQASISPFLNTTKKNDVRELQESDTTIAIVDYDPSIRKGLERLKGGRPRFSARRRNSWQELCANRALEHLTGLDSHQIISSRLVQDL
jgi:hypothetical protein